MDVQSRAKFDSLNSEVKTRAANSLEDREFIFKEDGEVEIFWRARGETRSTVGTWAIDQVTSLLTINSTSGISEYYVDNHDTDLVLRSRYPSGLFRALFLTKTP